MDSDRVSRARPYSGARPGRPHVFAYGTVTRCGPTFQSVRLTHDFVTSRPAGRADQDGSYNPGVTTAAACHITPVWALPFSLATTQGVEVSFLSSGYLDVSVPQLASRTLCIQVRVPAHYHWWVSPFGNRGVKGWSAPHPRLSQPPTSFIGSWRLGIHRVLFVS